MYQKSEKSYHKLIVWKRMMELVKLTYELTKLLPGEERYCLIGAKKCMRGTIKKEQKSAIYSVVTV